MDVPGGNPYFSPIVFNFFFFFELICLITLDDYWRLERFPCQFPLFPFICHSIKPNHAITLRVPIPCLSSFTLFRTEYGVHADELFRFHASNPPGVC